MARKSMARKSMARKSMARKWTKASRAKLSPEGEMEGTETAAAAEAL
jgi:hypothetical protein